MQFRRAGHECAEAGLVDLEIVGQNLEARPQRMAMAASSSATPELAIEPWELVAIQRMELLFKPTY